MMVWEFTRKAVERGHHVLTIFSEAGFPADCLSRAGISTYVLPLPSVAGARQLPRVLRAVLAAKPEVMLIHGTRMNAFAAPLSRLAGIPSVCVVHGLDEWRQTRPLWNALDRWYGRCNTHRIAVSRAVQSMLIEQRIVPPEKVTFIPNAIEQSQVQAIPRMEARQRFGINHDDLVVVTVARLVPSKGHRDLMQAARLLMSRFPSLKLLFIGDGELRSSLTSQARTLGLADRVVFAGTIENVRGLLPAFDLFALPSLREGMSIALIEALAAGLPVVATSIPGISEVISDQQTGLLVRSENAQALADAIERLLVDPGLRDRLASAGQSLARESYDIELMVDRYLDVLARAISGAHVGPDR